MSEIALALTIVLIVWLIFGSRRRPNGIGGFLTVRVISGLDGSDYLIRRYLLPRNRILNVYLHRFMGSDDDRALHDHPWHSISVVLKGRLIEHLPGDRKRTIGAGKFTIRGPKFQHRIELPAGQTAVTLFITGPAVRNWGFICPNGWTSWQKYGTNNGCE
ncbi:MAG: hypothetical protein OXI60_05140 [Acidiferrobacterales bacterium]|nr:hypothetical protein [Acidiferrobacterales bacterium]